MRFFNRITLQTPESVELEFTLAGIGNRALALLIDYLILSISLFLFTIIWIFVSVQATGVIKYFFGLTSLGLWLFAIALLVIFAIYTSYFVFFEALSQGQTPGKRFVKIRVIRDDGRPIGLSQATLRALLRSIDDILFIGAFLIALSPLEKRLGDWAAGTIVIQAQIPITVANIKISDQAKSVSTQLLEVANISALLPEDFAVIREYLHRREVMNIKAKDELSLRLAKEVKDVIELENLPQSLTPNVFLEAVYLAYQQLSSS